MERFYLRQVYQPSQLVYLKQTEHHHLKVMRARIGEEIEVVNGEGALASARIVAIEKEHTSLEILNVMSIERSTPQIFLGIPLMRPSKLEWVVEKGTEIGADAFFLYTADHSTQDSVSDHQVERLRNITISALKQSKRLYLPHLEIIPHLESLFKKECSIYFGDTRENALSLQKPNEDILFVTGPESGFSKEEIKILMENGTGVRLNPNILRAETAPLVALSLICAL